MKNSLNLIKLATLEYLNSLLFLMIIIGIPLLSMSGIAYLSTAYSKLYLLLLIPYFVLLGIVVHFPLILNRKNAQNKGTHE